MSEMLARARACESHAETQIRPEERPVFHLSPRTGWLNDPNGFSWYQGKYHLFYQYNPYGPQWGNIHWGHAVSSDLLRWEYLPAALAPDQPYDSFGCFSGTAVTLPDGRQLLLYTSTAVVDFVPEGKCIQTQSAAIGDGVDYQKVSTNPVLTAEDLPEGADPYEFRDPSLRKDGEEYLAIAASRNQLCGTQVVQFRSPDGLRWEFDRVLVESRGRIGGMWECPDYFRLDGRQVLIACAMDMEEETGAFHPGNNAFCMIGEELSDGSFRETALQTVDHGPDFYAPQTMLSPDGRSILIGWMQNPAVETAGLDIPFLGQMTIPRELSIRDGRLRQTPVRELSDYRRGEVRYRDIQLGPEELSLPGIRGRVLDLSFVVNAEPGQYQMFRCRFARKGDCFAELRYEPDTRILTVDRSAAKTIGTKIMSRQTALQAGGSGLTVRMILDRYSAEVFADDGMTVMSLTFYNEPDADAVTFSAEGSARMDITAYELDREVESEI